MPAGALGQAAKNDRADLLIARQNRMTETAQGCGHLVIGDTFDLVFERIGPRPRSEDARGLVVWMIWH